MTSFGLGRLPGSERVQWLGDKKTGETNHLNIARLQFIQTSFGGRIEGLGGPYV